MLNYNLKIVMLSKAKHLFYKLLARIKILREAQNDMEDSVTAFP